MSHDVLIRQATSDDIPELLRHRQGMYEDMGYNDAEAMSSDGLDLQTISGDRAGKRHASTPGWRARARKLLPADSCWSARGRAIPTMASAAAPPS